MSEFFEENRREYFDRLREVSRSDDWTGWCEFFLKAIAVQVDRNTTKAEAIIDLYKEKKEWMRNGVALKDFVLALDFLFQAVDFNTKAFIEKTGLNQVTARNFLVECAEKGLLACAKESKGSSPASYSFTEQRELIG